MSIKSAATKSSTREPGVWWMLLLLLFVLVPLLGGGLLPGYVLFSNDGPLGRQVSDCHRMPDIFLGGWDDLNSVGYRAGGAAPGISSGLRWLLGPVGISKFYAPLALLLLGISAWCFFRRLRLSPAACLLGGLAAALNVSFFSAACWGVASHPITIAMILLALAALIQTPKAATPDEAGRVGPNGPGVTANAPGDDLKGNGNGDSRTVRRDGRTWAVVRTWLRVMLAGFAVGMAVMEGADIGAIFSVFVAAFVLYQPWTLEAPRTRNLALGFGRLALIVPCAFLLAAQSVSVLLATNVENVAGTQQDAATKARRWNWATQWSLPKKEALGLIMPGLFGYRMSAPEGGSYWGLIGRDVAWDKYVASGQQGPPPRGFTRFSGGGFYAGVPVVLLALWAAGESLRRKNSVFNSAQRRWVWFWGAIGLVSLLLAFGRFAPFYRLLYALPYFSTIRNPTKFLHVLSLALVILFAYAVDGLWRRYVSRRAAVPWQKPESAPRWAGLGAWWAKANPWEKRWLWGCVLVWALSLVGWFVYASYREPLERYLLSVQLKEALVPAIASFSVSQPGWFVLFFALAAALLILFFSGAFAGPRTRWGSVVLGLLLVVDLARADWLWVVYWNYPEKYASNPIIDVLRDKPWQQRVALLPLRPSPQTALLEQLYRVEWSQHHFPYYNIQSLDVVQMPRKPVDLDNFEHRFAATNELDLVDSLSRRWELTNTRYLFGPANALNFLNNTLDPVNRRFRIAQRFVVVAKLGVLNPANASDLTAVSAVEGAFALFEFDGVLPRARLYSHWQVNSNNPAVLDTLASPAFDPQQTVIVSGGVPESTSVNTNQLAGTVEFVSYAPKDIRFKAQADTPAVLLLNDHYDPSWKVLVDGKPETLLRCNYLMRGVYLTPGPHAVEFLFQPSIKWLYVSLAALGVAVLGAGVLVVSGQTRTTQSSASRNGPLRGEDEQRLATKPESTRPLEIAPARVGVKTRKGQPNAKSQAKVKSNGATVGKR
jgi:hypothetical protein